jgi:hypothetical protein
MGCLHIFFLSKNIILFESLILKSKLKISKCVRVKYSNICQLRVKSVGIYSQKP